MRKILSLVLVLSLVLGSMSFAFAGNDITADIEDEAVKEAVERLAAFGIVDGMDDGKYHPELKVTREQFAKLVVEALGLGAAADAAKGATQFADVGADRWSSGYVNTAVGQGILRGYPDGTFKPTKEVSYGEAVTMLVRGLGYQDRFLHGAWPGNYVAKAAELDITDDVKFSASGTADRGSVAVMLNNTLDAEVVKADKFEGDDINYEVSDETLLENKLGIDKVEEIRVVATKRLDDKLNSDELTLLAIEDDVEIDGINYDEDDEIEVEYKESVSAEALVGLQITGYFDDELLIYTEIETPASSYFRSIAYEDGQEDEDGEDDDGKLYIRESGKFYKFDKNLRFYINNEDVTDEIEWDDDDDRELVFNLTELLDGEEMDYKVQGASGHSYAFGNVVLEKGKVAFVDLATFEIVNGVVLDVDTDDSIVKYVDTFTEGNASEDEELDLEDYDEFYLYDTDGAALELEDLEKDDVIYFYEDGNDDDKAYIMVKREEAVTGELTKVKRGKANTGQTRGKVYVDDTAYSLANDFAYSLDEMDSVESGNRQSDLDDIFDDVYDEDVKIVRDTKGRVALLTTDVEATTGNYAVIIGTDKGIDDVLKLWTETGDTITYDVDDYENGFDFDDLDEGDIIEYDVEDDGDIDVIAKVYDASSGDAVDYDGSRGRVIKVVELDEISDDNVEDEDGDNYYDRTDSLYIDYSEYKENDENDDDDLEVLKWVDFEDLDIPSAGSKNAVEVLIVTHEDEDDEIEFLAFLENYDEVADDDAYVGYLIDYETDGDVMTVEVDVFEEGKKEYTVSSDDDQDEIKDIGYEAPIIFVLRGGELKLKDSGHDDYDIIGDADGGSIWFKEKDGNDIVVYEGSEDDDEDYKLDKDAVIYLEEDEKSVNSIDEGDALEFIIKDNEIVVIKYTEEEDLEDGMKLEDADVDEKVKEVRELISDLPDPDEIELSDKSDVEEAREAYEDLTSSQQNKISDSLVEKLEDCEAKLEEIVPEATATADVLVGSIEAIKRVTVTETSVEGAEFFTVNGGSQVAIGEQTNVLVSGGSTTVEVEILDVDGKELASGTLDVSATKTVEFEVK